MDIKVTYDATVSSAPSGFKTVVADVVKYFDSLFANPITVNIDVGWGEVDGSPISSGALGESVSSLTLGFTYAEVKAALAGNAVTADSKTGVASLGSTDPTKGGDFALTTAEAKALALIGSSSSPDGWVGFDSTAGTFSFITSNTSGSVATGKYDLFAVVAHEISEVLGRQMNFGVTFGSGTGHVYEPLDLFDYTASGVRSFTGGTSGRYFSIDGGATSLDPYSSDPGGDQFDWASGAGHDAFDAFSDPSVINSVTATDIILLNLMGYMPTPDFTASALSLSGPTLTFHVNNISEGAAAASTAGIYLSTTSKISTSGVHLSSVATPAIAGLGTAILSAPLKLSSTLAAGDYWVGVIADSTGSVVESNTANDASTGLAIEVVDSSNIASISGVASAHAFDVAGATLAAPLTLTGQLTTSAALDGAETLTVSGGDLSLETGTSLTVSGVTLSAAKSIANVGSSLSFAGAWTQSAGTLKLAAGATFTLSGADSFAGTVSGAGTLALAGGTATFSSGVVLTVAKVTETAAGAVASFSGATISATGVWSQTAGTITAPSGDRVNFSGKADVFSGTLAGAGTIAFTGGSDTLSGATLKATSMIISGAAVALSGAIVDSTSLTVTTTSLTVAAAGATLSGGGSVNLTDLASNVIKGATSAATLTNSTVKITGAGHLGNGVMTLVNASGGTIIGNATNVLTIDTGANTITNAGKIESTASGGVTIKSAIANTGSLTVSAGTLTLDGAVTGAGRVYISGGVADVVTSSFVESVTFTKAAGMLELAHSVGYTGSVAGFSKTGSTALDLTDIAFGGSTKATYSGTTASGTLTVTDGAHTARIKLVGDFTSSTFTVASDGHGGTSVVDPTKAPAAIQPLIGAMAGFAARSHAGGPAATCAARAGELPLALPHTA